MKKHFLLIPLLMVLSFGAISSQKNDINIKPTYASYSYEHAGTREDPYSVQDALEKCAEVGTTATGTFVTKGIVCHINEIQTSMWQNATFFISDDGSRNNELEIYRGFYINGDGWTEETAALLTVGKVVTIEGSLVNYKGNTKEYTSGSQIVSIEEQHEKDFVVNFVYVQTVMKVGDMFEVTSAQEEYTYNLVNVDYYSSDENVVQVLYNTQIESYYDYNGNYHQGNTYSFVLKALAKGSIMLTVEAISKDGLSKKGYGYTVITVYDELDSKQTVEIGQTLPVGTVSEERYFFEGSIYLYDVDHNNILNLKYGYQDKFWVTEYINIYFGSSNQTLYEEIKTRYQTICGNGIYLTCQIQNNDGVVRLINPNLVGLTEFSLGNNHYHTEETAATFLSMTCLSCNYYQADPWNLGIYGSFENAVDNYENIFSRFRMTPYWEKIDSSRKTYFKTADAEELINSISKPNQTVGNFLKRYDYIVAKYGVSNFLEREITPLQMSYLSTSILDENGSTLIVVITVLISTTLCLGLILIKKKRYHSA